MRLLHPSDYRVMPWKDGGGTTTELAIEPPGASLSDPFLWRLSSARVAVSGPFSRFPGRDRALALVEGAGLILDLEGQGRLRLKHPLKPVAFSGEVQAHATLIQGPCVDLGLIWDPARMQGELQVLKLGPDARALVLAPTTLIVCPRGGAVVDPVGVPLGPWDTLRFEGADPGTQLGLCAPAGEALVMACLLTPR